MKTNTLFTAFLALLLPLASLCKEHTLADASNLRKNTEVISDIEESHPFQEIFKAALLDKAETVLEIISSLCEEDKEDSAHDWISADIDAEMEETGVASYLCSLEASGFVINAATTALTELASSGEMMTMMSSFIKEDEDEAPGRLLLRVGFKWTSRFINGKWVRVQTRIRRPRS